MHGDTRYKCGNAMIPYVIIQTVTDRYKCHGYSRKAGRIYFNSRAVNMKNVVSITEYDGVVSYNNPELQVREVKRTTTHHCSTLKGADVCKATKKKVVKPKVSKDVIEI